MDPEARLLLFDLLREPFADEDGYVPRFIETGLFDGINKLAESEEVEIGSYDEDLAELTKKFERLKNFCLRKAKAGYREVDLDEVVRTFDLER